MPLISFFVLVQTQNVTYLLPKLSIFEHLYNIRQNKK